MAHDALQWETDPTDWRPLAAVRYLPVAYFGGHVGLAVLALFVLGTDSSTDSSVLAVLVGGIGLILLRVGRTVVPLVATERPETSERPEFLWDWNLRPVGIVLASVGGLAALLLCYRLTTYGELVLFVACLVVPVLLVAPFYGRGELDTDAGTLTYQGRTIDRATIAGVSEYVVGPFVLFRLRFESGVGRLWGPRLVAAPVEKRTQLGTELHRGEATTTAAEPAERDMYAFVALAGVGLLFVGFAAFVLVGVGAVDPVFRAYIGGIAGVFGVLMFAGARYLT